MLIVVAIADQEFEVVFPAREAQTVTSRSSNGELGCSHSGYKHPDHQCTHGCFDSGPAGRRRFIDLLAGRVNPNRHRLTSHDGRILGPVVDPSATAIYFAAAYAMLSCRTTQRVPV